MICNQDKWKEIINIDELKTINTRPRGTKHVPVNHGLVLERFNTLMYENKYNVVEQQGLLSHDSLRYIYLAEVNIAGVGNEYNYNVGFVNYNDRTKSLTGLAGTKVFVCSNGMISHEITASRKRHLNNIVECVDDSLNETLSEFDRFIELREKEIGIYKGTKIDEDCLGKVVLELHRNKIISNTNIDELITQFDNPIYEYKTDGDTMWDLENAYSHIAKRIKNPVLKADTDKNVRGLLNKICKIDN